jgi:hypothetical protein
VLYGYHAITEEHWGQIEGKTDGSFAIDSMHRQAVTLELVSIVHNTLYRILIR